MINDPPIILDRTDSTQNEILRCGYSVVIAYQQSEGRGRYGRRWQSYDGNLHLSIALAATYSPRDRGLSFVAGLALWDSLRAVLPSSVIPTLKWPNDILINGRKAGGVLIECYPSKVILGVGINIIQKPDPAWSTSLTDWGVFIHPQEMANIFLKQLSFWLFAEHQKGLSSILLTWEDRGAKRGSIVSWNGYQGYFVGLSKDGGMLIQDNQSGLITRMCY